MKVDELARALACGTTDDEEAPMEGWIDELAAELGEDPLTREEVVRLLEASRDVAHRVERKTTPLAAFLLGTAVGRAEGGGMERPRAMEGVFGTLARVLPDVPPDAAEAPPASPDEVEEARGEASGSS
ncbi:MAG TPA: DUF6457 domain-containing protein [Actinomycetota bacterium]|nr:DUF6457 domain-containing protein [Actinomycetota bacterium]